MRDGQPGEAAIAANSLLDRSWPARAADRRRSQGGFGSRYDDGGARRYLRSRAIPAPVIDEDDNRLSDDESDQPAPFIRALPKP
jgi:hypothetical protein